MSETPEELEEIVREFHHLLEEHRRAGIEGTGRRHLETQLAELEQRFESLLTLELAGEHDRAAWRERLHHGKEAPPPPTERPLVFKGRSEGGSTVEIRVRPDGDLEVEIDGSLVERLGGEVDFDVYRDAEREYREVVDAAPEAVAALAAWVADPRTEPPREHLHILHEEGLVDRHFGLTSRGRRVLAKVA